MSQIMKALKKAQMERPGLSNDYTVEHAPEQAAHHAPVKSLMNYLPMFGMGLAVLLSLFALGRLEFSKNALSDLTNSVETQQRKIDRLSLLLDSNKKSYEGQIKDLNLKLAQLTKEYKIKVYSLSVASSNQFQQLQDEISDNKRKMYALTSDIKSLNKRIDGMADSMKVTTTP